MKKITISFLILALLFSTTAMAANNYPSDTSAGTTIVDLTVARPAGIIATGVGCVVFVAALPFTVWSKERLSKAGKALVVKPAHFAFVRPLGEGL